jgi:hypothetical protein
MVSIAPASQSPGEKNKAWFHQVGGREILDSNPVLPRFYRV